METSEDEEWPSAGSWTDGSTGPFNEVKESRRPQSGSLAAQKLKALTANNC